MKSPEKMKKELPKDAEKYAVYIYKIGKGWIFYGSYKTRWSLNWALYWKLAYYPKTGIKAFVKNQEAQPAL